MIRAFLDATPGLVEAKTRSALHRVIPQQGRSWLEAAREVTDDYYDEVQRDQAAEAGRQYQGETRSVISVGKRWWKGSIPDTWPRIVRKQIGDVTT